MEKIEKNMVLSIKNLTISTFREGKNIKLLDNVGFNIYKNQIIGVIGETGSGKTLTMLAIMKMLPNNMKIDDGKIFFLNKNLIDIPENEFNAIRGKDLSMIFQYQKLLLSPVYKISTQMKDIIKVHNNLSNHDLDHLILNLLSQVGFKNPSDVFNKFPFQLSGGMFQRVMLAIAISMAPKLLIADEPTTALDPEIQNIILSKLKSFQQDLRNSIIIITHDFSVIKKICTHVIVMKHGSIIEKNTVENILKYPQNEYTKHLINFNHNYI